MVNEPWNLSRWIGQNRAWLHSAASAFVFNVSLLKLMFLQFVGLQEMSSTTALRKILHDFYFVVLLPLETSCYH